MAEIRRPAAGRERSRGSELDIQRAVNAARSPKDSKFGECLINVNTKQDPILKLRLGRISTEMRRMEFRVSRVVVFVVVLVIIIVVSFKLAAEMS